ncbi:Rab-GTPase-TBC domain [Phytophthora infestans]|uniref:Rab-GTPase-TBC domain n=1 Tax=Phytophthora infestans TaxID=4787 RepID=A0A833SPD3_PHYIN|nr:Rab-GTPase-TBC domain [Phytophthora infestans]
MGSKRHDRRRVRGIPGRALAARERRLIQHKEKQLRVVIIRLRALVRDSSVATVEDRDECFREVRRLAITPKGLVSDEFRRDLWPFLLGIGEATHNTRPVTNSDLVEVHRDAAQVEKDVERSLWHYDVLQGIKESERRAKRRALTQIILGALSANDELFYFQGYHDIVSVFLLTLGSSPTTMQAVQNVSETYQREPMRPGFEQVMATTRLLFPLLDAADELLFQHLRASGVEPFFALPWMITWFAHQLKRFGDVKRLFDVFLVTHPLFSLYVSAGVVLEARDKICGVIARALVLFHQLPPEQLIKQSDMDAGSVQNAYFRFPLKFQPWPSVTKPMLKDVPPLPSRSRDGDKTNYTFGSWQISIIATTVIGVVAVASAYAFRDRIVLHA